MVGVGLRGLGKEILNSFKGLVADVMRGILCPVIVKEIAADC